jgi:steroid 5-alpha reductase family enzyme
MTALYLKALAAIAVSLSVLMAGAWVVQQRTGNSGWVDTIWTFSLGLVGAGRQPLPHESGVACGIRAHANDALLLTLVLTFSRTLRWSRLTIQ